MASVVQKVRPDVYNDSLQPYEKPFKINFKSNFLMKETQILAPAWAMLISS